MGRGQRKQAQVFTRTRSDEIIVEETQEDDLFLFKFKSAQAGPLSNQDHQGIIDGKTRAKLEKSKDPVEDYLNSQSSQRDKYRLYQLLSPVGQEILTDKCFEDLGRNMADAFAPLEPLPADFRSQLIHFDQYDHTFWKPDHNKPISRPTNIEIWTDHFEADALQKHLDQHPYVLETRTKKSYHPDALGTIEAIVKLPQDIHDRVYDFNNQKSPPSIQGFSPSSMREVLIWPNHLPHDPDYDRKLNGAQIKDVLGVRPFARSQEEIEDDDSY
jgi:hypothetical protein